MTKSGRVCKSRSVFAGMLLLLLSASPSVAGVMTPEYARANFRPRTMVLLPPLAEVIKDQVTSSEQMIEEASILEDATTAVLKEQFAALGYEIFALSVDQVNADPELQRMVRNLNERYDADLVQVQRKPKDVRNRRFSLGDEARILAERLNAEAIIVSRISASGATGGQQTMAILFGGSMGYATLSLGIIAGDNGDLEAYLTGIDSAVSAKQLSEQPRETAAKLSANALKKFPAADKVAKIKKSWPQSTDRKASATTTSDAKVLSDLEALFEDTAEDSAPAPEPPMPTDE